MVGAGAALNEKAAPNQAWCELWDARAHTLNSRMLGVHPSTVAARNFSRPG